LAAGDRRGGVTDVEIVRHIGNATLRAVARELLATVRDDGAIDWIMRENLPAQLRVLLKRNRRLPKDFESLAETLATFVTVVSTQLALRRLAGV